LALRFLAMLTSDRLIGGLHLALKRSSQSATILRAFDRDHLACQVYSANFPSIPLSKVDISTLSLHHLQSLHADLWLCSPSCQPYTVLNPNAKGSSDPRATSFLHLISSVLPQLVTSESAPTRILVENVAGFEVPVNSPTVPHSPFSNERL
jgi:tRNA (cytosine38-C5)-methyltransferase